MSHELDFSTGTAAIAIAQGTETPWHGFGNVILPTDTVDEQAEKAGLAWSVIKGNVQYTAKKLGIGGDGKYGMQDVAMEMPGRSVLYRSDTLKPLSVMSSNRYKVVQPIEILSFFDDIAKTGNFKLDVAGALKGGKKIWGIARVDGGANIIGQDHVRPFLLFHTSFDGSAATTVRFVTERVVCANTLAIAMDEQISGIKMNHSKAFDSAEVQKKLGIIHEAHDAYVAKAQLLTSKGVSDAKAEELVVEILARGNPTELEAKDIRETRAYKKMIAMFHGTGLIGRDLDGGKSAWRMLNVATQFVDHERGKNRETGLDSAWFGEGSRMKQEAMELLLAL